MLMNEKEKIKIKIEIINSFEELADKLNVSINEIKLIASEFVKKSVAVG